MNRARVVGTIVLAVLMAGAVFVVVALSGKPPADPGGCPYTATDSVANYELTPMGEFRYNDSGPHVPSEKLVILVAGYPDPHYFDAVRELLIEKKYRVLVLDLPGKGHTRLSGTPTAAYIVDKFQRLWNDPTRNLHSASDVLIVGTSISSPVAALMAARWSGQSGQSLRLALVSALGMPRPWNAWRHPFLVNTGRIPVLSDLAAPFVLPWLTRDSWEHGEILCSDHFPEVFERQRREFLGAYAAINYLELTRALVLTDQTQIYRQLQDTSVPVWQINGDHDPFGDQIDKLETVLSHGVRLEKRLITDAAHIPFIEKPIETFRILQEALLDGSH